MARIKRDVSGTPESMYRAFIRQLVAGEIEADRLHDDLEVVGTTDVLVTTADLGGSQRILFSTPKRRLTKFEFNDPGRPGNQSPAPGQQGREARTVPRA